MPSAPTETWWAFCCPHLVLWTETSFTIHPIACVTGLYLDWREARDIERGALHTSACPKCMLFIAKTREDGRLKECILAREPHTLVSQGQLARVCLNTIRWFRWFAVNIPADWYTVVSKPRPNDLSFRFISNFRNKERNGMSSNMTETSKNRTERVRGAGWWSQKLRSRRKYQRLASRDFATWK